MKQDIEKVYFMRMLREVTKWHQVDYEVKNHDYLVDDNKEFCFAYRKAGSDDWEKFKKQRRFTKTYRRFKELKEETPKNFITPHMANPWDSKEYNSLETYFG